MKGREQNMKSWLWSAGTMDGVRLYPVEVGARGFVGDSMTHLLKYLELQGA